MSEKTPDPAEARPDLSAGLNGAEFRRWYWLKDELTAFARELGISTAGGKDLLAERIASSLDGVAFTEPARAPRGGTRQLTGTLTARTVIPPGQRCSQVLRDWFARALGPGFHFDGPMREFIAGADGVRTLGDALDHWHRTRDDGPRPIDSQFEYNRFTRAWHLAHPDGGPEQLRAAWREYRATPSDRRERA